MNRLGLNIFWHHFWYSDTCYSSYSQQDMLLKLLIDTYITYGSRVNTQLFWNSYWFKTTRYTYSVNLQKYYRWASIINKLFHTVTNYRFRLTGEDLIRSRFNLLRFNSWVIINIFWFQPNKAYKRLSLTGTLTELVYLQSQRRFIDKKLMRLRSLLYHTFYSNCTFNSSYCF